LTTADVQQQEDQISKQEYYKLSTVTVITKIGDNIEKTIETAEGKMLQLLDTDVVL
jgi:hypothetical protein